MKQIVKLTITYEQDTETGEMTVISQELSNQPINNPKLFRNSNTLSMNNAAFNLMGLKVGDRMEIGYRRVNNITFPVIFKSDKGNKISKSYSIACRGTVNKELEKYGKEFDVKVFADDIYKLIPKENIIEEELNDPYIEVPELEDKEETLDDELNELLDNSLEENSNNIFKF